MIQASGQRPFRPPDNPSRYGPGSCLWSYTTFRGTTRISVVAHYEASSEAEALSSQILQLSRQTETQNSLHARMIKVTAGLWRTRLLLFTEKDDALPMPFLVVLVFWITIIFVSFSLFAQPTPMVIGELLIFALSVTGAVYLILELSQPFRGLMQIRSDPLRDALLPLDQER